MKKTDLITGFLGSGKTTFLKLYANYFLKKNQRLGIIENDYGAVNVDMMLLKEIESDNCWLEMISGGCDADCHKRRFKTKLISLGMQNFDRILVEPSGIFDVEEFHDVLQEEPLDCWYSVGNVIAVADLSAKLPVNPESEYLFVNQIANAGCIILSKITAQTQFSEIDERISKIQSLLAKYHCPVPAREAFITKPWDELNDADFDKISSCGYHTESIPKLYQKEKEDFSSVYLMNLNLTEEKLQQAVHLCFHSGDCGHVIRVKGFWQKETGEWYELNATTTGIRLQPIKEGQNVIIVIGEALKEDIIRAYYIL